MKKIYLLLILLLAYGCSPDQLLFNTFFIVAPFIPAIPFNDFDENTARGINGGWHQVKMNAFAHRYDSPIIKKVPTAELQFYYDYWLVHYKNAPPDSDSPERIKLKKYLDSFGVRVKAELDKRSNVKN